MKILVGVWHPAHVHFFRNIIKILTKKGHEAVVMARDKDSTYDLLNLYGIDFIPTTIHRKKLSSKSLDFFERWTKIYKIMSDYKPDIAIGIADFYISQIGKLLGIKSIVFQDTENAFNDKYLTFPFSTNVLTPDCFAKEAGLRHVKYNGYHELSYLHPNVFVPKKEFIRNMGIEKQDKLVVLRFVPWDALHDIGHEGLTNKNKILAVRAFSKFAKIVISSESPLPKELESFRIKLSPEKIHHVLAYADLFYGESATMASECSVLGTHSIFLDSFGRGYTDEQEKKYGLVYNFSGSLPDQSLSIRKGIELLKNPNLKSQSQIKSKKLISDKIDVSSWAVDFILSKMKVNNYV